MEIISKEDLDILESSGVSVLYTTQLLVVDIDSVVNLVVSDKLAS